MALVGQRLPARFRDGWTRDSLAGAAYQLWPARGAAQAGSLDADGALPGSLPPGPVALSFAEYLF